MSIFGGGSVQRKEKEKSSERETKARRGFTTSASAHPSLSVYHPFPEAVPPVFEGSKVTIFKSPSKGFPPGHRQPDRHHLETRGSQRERAGLGPHPSSTSKPWPARPHRHPDTSPPPGTREGRLVRQRGRWRHFSKQQHSPPPGASPGCTQVVGPQAAPRTDSRQRRKSVNFRTGTTRRPKLARPHFR